MTHHPNNPLAPSHSTEFSCQDWKNGHTSSFGNVRAYQPTPPQTPGASKEVDLNTFPFKLVKVEYDMNPGKKGWDKLKILLPPNIRQRHVDDPIHGGEWREILCDFDAKHFGQHANHLNYTTSTIQTMGTHMT